jgi:hypothetical protein
VGGRFFPTRFLRLGKKLILKLVSHVAVLKLVSHVAVLKLVSHAAVKLVSHAAVSNRCPAPKHAVYTKNTHFSRFNNLRTNRAPNIKFKTLIKF